jgi:hypothetical protein
VKRGFLLAALALNLAACATVQHGPVQRIPVDSEPAGAVVYTEDCGPGSTKEATTPGVIWVSRRAERCALTFTAPGYELERVQLTRAIAEEFLENLDLLDVCADATCDDFFFIGGFLAGAGFGVDALTGALFEQQPNGVFVSLVPFEELELEIDREREEPEEPPDER